MNEKLFVIAWINKTTRIKGHGTAAFTFKDADFIRESLNKSYPYIYHYLFPADWDDPQPEKEKVEA